MTTIRFSAEVNGTERSVEVDADDIGGWAVEWATEGTQGGIEMYVMNTYSLYSAFYEGASGADYDAPLENVTAEVVQ